MKHKKIIYAIAIVSFIGVNAMTTIDNLNSSGTSLKIIFQKANADIPIGGYENWQKCTLEGGGGSSIETCEDPCDGTSGTSCNEAIACSAGLQGEC